MKLRMISCKGKKSACGMHDDSLLELSFCGSVFIDGSNFTGSISDVTCPKCLALIMQIKNSLAEAK